MDLPLPRILEDLKDIVRSMNEQHTGILRSIKEEQTAFLTSMKNQQIYMNEQLTGIFRSMKEEQTAFLTSMKNQQMYMNEHQTCLLTSIIELLAKINASSYLQTKDEDHMKKGKGEQKVTKQEEAMCDSYEVKQLYQSPVPWHSSSRMEKKKYRLHIVGEVWHEEIHVDGNVMKRNVIKGKQIPCIEVVLKHGDEQVPASHPLASVRVELVVLDAKFRIEESTDWHPKEFEDHIMMVAKDSSTRMTVEAGRFSLDGGRKVHSVASIKDSSWKQKVKLGVMVVQDGSVQDRVLEGVSSNEFYVIHERRRDATCANKESKRQTTGNSELNINGKRVINRDDGTTLHPTASSYSQFSGHVQSPQKIGQHATGEQPSIARNACPTQNCLTTQIGNIGGAVPPQSYAPNSYQGLPALFHNRFGDNHGIPSEEAYDDFMLDPHDNKDHVDLSSQIPMMGKRVHIDTTLQPSALYSQFSGHVQSPQIFGQHAMGEQPSHARNACLTQNHLAAPIGAGNIRGVVPPQAYAPNPNAALVQTKLDDNQGNFLEDVSNKLLMDDEPDDNRGINPVHENPQGLQKILGQFGDILQGGGQGQPGTLQSNNLHTNSQGHTTTAAMTDDATSAQMDINSTMDDHDAKMGGHEHDDGDEDDEWDFDKLLSTVTPAMYDQV